MVLKKFFIERVIKCCIAWWSKYLESIIEIKIIKKYNLLLMKYESTTHKFNFKKWLVEKLILYIFKKSVIIMDNTVI